MIFIMRSLAYLFASAMACVGIFFTYKNEVNEYLKIFKIIFLILAAIVFIVFSIQDLINFIKNRKWIKRLFVK